MNILNQVKSVDSFTSQREHFFNEHIKVKSTLSKPKADIIDTQKRILLPPRKKPIKPTSVIVEYPQEDNLMISNDRLTSSEIDSLTTSLSRTLDQVLTSKEKDFRPFWTLQSKEISEKLWLPTKIDYVDSVLNCSKQSSLNAPMGQSWFSIKEKLLLKKNSLMTSFQSSQCSLQGCTDSEVIPLKSKSKIQSKKNVSLKTLKGRFLPTKEQKEQLQLMMEQSRWYYNFLVSSFQSKMRTKDNIKALKSVSFYSIRDLLTEYDYVEESDETRYFKCRETDDTTQLCPPWWTQPYSRLPRGVAKKFSQNINSILSNYHNKNIDDFEIHFRSKKNSNTEFILFEDKNFPVFIRDMKSQYWYTDTNGRKQRSSFKDLFHQTDPRGLEIIYDKIKDHYYFCYPVDYNFYPEKDRRNESQVHYRSYSKDERVISLDPGIRKFMVGYDPNKCMVYIGEGANKELIEMLYRVDKTRDPLLWRRIKNRVNELHWKTISYLLKNYDKIIIPDFRISGMVKQKKLTRMTKRLLYMYSFHSFMLKLKFKCKNTNTKLYIVGEEYTSKTCTQCGKINNVGSSERYKCENCNLVIDRDVNGSRNIMIKNIKLW